MERKTLDAAETLYQNKEFDKAFKVYEFLANQGDKIAQHKTGRMYDDGEGVEKDFLKAAYWYEQAAKQGYIDSQFNLAGLYLYGDGVKESWDKAYYWFREAAKKGDQGAQDNLRKVEALSAPEDPTADPYLFIVNGLEFEDVNGALWEILPSDTESIKEDLIRYLNRKWPEEARDAINLAMQEDYAYPELSHYWDVLANERGCEYLADVYEFMLNQA